MKAVDRRLPDLRIDLVLLLKRSRELQGRMEAGRQRVAAARGEPYVTRAHESPGCRTDVSVGNIAGGVNPPSYPYPDLRPVSP